MNWITKHNMIGNAVILILQEIKAVRKNDR